LPLGIRGLVQQQYNGLHVGTEPEGHVGAHLRRGVGASMARRRSVRHGRQSRARPSTFAAPPTSGNSVRKD
jgi:hypothetical protein